MPPHPVGTASAVVVTGFKATRARNLTTSEKEANRMLAAGRAPVEHAADKAERRAITPLIRQDH